MKVNNIILYACTAFAGGIWQAKVYQWTFITLAMLVVILALTSFWRLYHNHQRSFNAVLALFFVAGMLCYSQSVLVRDDDISHYAGQTVNIEGTIKAVPEITSVDKSRLVRYTVDVEKIVPQGKESTIHTSGQIRVTIQYQDTMKRPAVYGDKVSIKGKVLELNGYNNPGQIDMVLALKRQGITARMFAQEQNIKVLAAGQSDSWRTILANWRQTIIAALLKVMPVNDAAILTAVLFGGYQGINKNVIDDFAATGLIHILSVSGAHIALVVGIITWIGRHFRWNCLFTLCLAAATVCFYAYMSGLTPPVIRSAIMGIIGLLAVILERDSYAPAALAISALLLLVFQPLLLFDISFQLSFGATAGLIFLYQKTLVFLSRIPSWLAGPIAVTLAAQLGVLPIIAWYFNNFSLISFVANIIVLPIIELVIILGLTGVIVYMVFSFGGNVIFVLSSLFLGLVMLLTKLLSAIPYSSVYIPAVGLTGCSVYYVLLAWIYGWRPFQLPSPQKLVTTWPRASILTLVVLVALFTMYAYYPRPLSVHFIDVGQGDATLIITPHGKAVLVDAGGTLGNSGFDVGERVVAPYLKHYGIRTVDYLILTHAHQDHAGGAAGVAGKINIINVLLPQEAYSPSIQALLHTTSHIAVIPSYTGQSFQIDNVAVHIEQAMGKGHTGRQVSNNEDSAVVRITYGQHSFLLTGDLNAQGEELLLTNKVAPCTVLKVGHHGARTSTTESFLQALAPDFAVISAGYQNRFGHPHPETLSRLAKAQTAVYRTDKQGAIVFTSDGKNIEVDSYLK